MQLLCCEIKPVWGRNARLTHSKMPFFSFFFFATDFKIEFWKKMFYMSCSLNNNKNNSLEATWRLCALLPPKNKTCRAAAALNNTPLSFHTLNTPLSLISWTDSWELGWDDWRDPLTTPLILLRSAGSHHIWEQILLIQHQLVFVLRTTWRLSYSQATTADQFSFGLLEKMKKKKPDVM